jgi:hypothetical protein
MQWLLIRDVDISNYGVAKLQKAEAGKSTGKNNKKQKRRRRNEEAEGERKENQSVRLNDENLLDPSGSRNEGENSRRKGRGKRRKERQILRAMRVR